MKDLPVPGRSHISLQNDEGLTNLVALVLAKELG